MVVVVDGRGRLVTGDGDDVTWLSSPGAGDVGAVLLDAVVSLPLLDNSTATMTITTRTATAPATRIGAVLVRLGGAVGLDGVRSGFDDPGTTRGGGPGVIGGSGVAEVPASSDVWLRSFPQLEQKWACSRVAEPHEGQVSINRPPVSNGHGRRRP